MATLGQTSTRETLVYVAWKCSSRVNDIRDGLVMSVECECPDLDCRCDPWRVACATIIPNHVCGSSIECILERCALEADGRACLSIEAVALKVCGLFGRFCLRLHRGYFLVGPFLLKYGKKDPIGVLGEV
ncbi:hypothetical protein CDL15_Pgr012472 [Punica granatum]|uniref:Uncharacterized protein n=1 Tax=Punica granatum TaxID=22663 RepID=A0A218WZI2_PUNGR|nr:hypothetical protein CDL15_Pgr012472 [Punica granatum]